MHGSSIGVELLVEAEPFELLCTYMSMYAFV